MTKVGDSISASNASWSFGGSTVLNFEDHVSKSVPFYREGQDLICQISDFFLKNDSICYELGTSAGTLADKLATYHEGKGTQFIGIDHVEEMISYAKNHYDRQNLEFIVDDVLTHDYQDSDLFIAYYLLQFIHPSMRQDLVNIIYNRLRWGGAFICFEKVRAPDPRFQDLASSLYTDYKLIQGYTPEEIISKSRSLKGVLEPFSTQGNIDLFKRAGFVDIMSIQKYICFEGFLCIK